MWLRSLFFASVFGALWLCAAPGARAGDAPVNAPGDAPVDTLVIETAGGAHAFTVEFAGTPAARRKGLMGREILPADHGMLFDFRGAPRVTMWMKDTPLSLDMLFLGRRGRVLGIAENTVPFSTETIFTPPGTSAVLELLGGTAARIGAAAGDRVRHPLFHGG